MKTLKTTTAFLAAALTMMSVACDSDDEKTDTTPATPPTLTLAQNEITVSAEGGIYSISYTLQNPVNGGNFSVTTSASWISGISTSNSGLVSFLVAENKDGKSRTATITLSYAYSIVGSMGTLTENVTVTQEYEEEDDGNDDNDEGDEGDDDDGDDNDGDGNGDGGDGGDEGDDGDDSGDGGDGGDDGDGDDDDDDDEPNNWITVADVVGTYTASGTVYDNYNMVSRTWTVKILEDDASEDKLNIDGLAYHHTGDTFYYASATLIGGDNAIIIPTQMVGWGYNTGNGDEIAWCGYTPCVTYDSSSYSFGWSAAGPDCILRYDEATETWTSDYGMLFAAFINWNLTSMYDWYDLIVPTFTLKKTSSSTNGVKTTSTSPDSKAPEKKSSRYTPVMTH